MYLTTTFYVFKTFNELKEDCKQYDYHTVVRQPFIYHDIFILR